MTVRLYCPYLIWTSVNTSSPKGEDSTNYVVFSSSTNTGLKTSLVDLTMPAGISKRDTVLNGNATTNCTSPTDPGCNQSFSFLRACHTFSYQIPGVTYCNTITQLSAQPTILFSKFYASDKVDYCTTNTTKVSVSKGDVDQKDGLKSYPPPNPPLPNPPLLRASDAS
jgi:hypothetical protein